MFVREFTGRDRTRAAKKALDFWYRHLRDAMFLKEFLSQCTWRKEESGVVITYRGFTVRKKEDNKKKT